MNSGYVRMQDAVDHEHDAIIEAVEADRARCLKVVLRAMAHWSVGSYSFAEFGRRVNKAIMEPDNGA